MTILQISPLSGSNGRRETNAAYLDRLISEANSHHALRHPWLRSIQSGDAGDLRRTFQDFAVEYQGYQSWFPQYLELVIRSLDKPLHKALLRHNLDEEKGRMDDDDRESLRRIGIDPGTVDGVPHPVLFRRFCTAIGVSDRALERPTRAALAWRREFMAFLSDASPAAAVGALGLGTEQIVEPLYQMLLEGIRRLGLPREDYVFFELHCEVDDQHKKDLLAIAAELVDSDQGRADLRRGMLTALDLRAAFWSHLHARTPSITRVLQA